MSQDPLAGTIRLARLSVPAKLMLTLFLALIGLGYLVAAANIYEHHQDADLEPGMGLDDLRRVYHGLDKVVQADATPESAMLKMVRPGGKMRKYLERGEEEEITSLISWLEGGAPEAGFAVAPAGMPDHPSPQDVIVKRCQRCHNRDGDKDDAPYASDRRSPVEYELVAKYATPPPPSEEGEVRHLAPTSRADLVQITHAHILSIPVFALIVGGLFLLTGVRPSIKTVVTPLPMLAILVDIGSWWLARPFEPAIFLIPLAGAVFGATLGFQILCVLGSLWLGRRVEG